MQVQREGFCRLGPFVIALLWTLASLPPGVRAASSSLNDHGTFEISVAGRKIGRETFRIVPAGDTLIAEAEIELHTQKGGNALVFHSFPRLVLDSHLQPLSYTWVQRGAGNSRLRIDFTTAPVRADYRTLKGKDDGREFLLPKDVVILDDNVLNQYEILVDRYAQTSRGLQVFKAFIPQEALPGQLKIVETGTEQVTINGKSESLRHLRVTTDLARIDLWADSQGHVQQISVPALQFNAVRQQATEP